MRRPHAAGSPWSRRHFLRRGVQGVGMLAVGGRLVGCTDSEAGPPPECAAPTPAAPATPGSTSRLATLGPLGPADAHGVRVPSGFTARVIARSGEPVVACSPYAWHGAPDGGAVFPMDDGGWVYVSNSEVPDIVGVISGGVGAIRFDASGAIVDAYPILTGTQLNCAGGATPWGTWLSCEEHAEGRVWECDPVGNAPAIERRALGIFKHEAVAVDPATLQLYLTEDEPDGRLYRFTPASSEAGVPDLSSGALEVAEVSGPGPEGSVTWHAVPDPQADSGTPTRAQVPASTAFDGGEGIDHHGGVIYFATKGDDRVWAYDIGDSSVSVLYDRNTSPTPILGGVDNLTVTASGDVVVAEDPGDLQIVAITSGGNLVPLVQLEGHDGSEITGPAFDPSRTRLYFSSQRAGGALFDGGVTFCVEGPFFD